MAAAASHCSDRNSKTVVVSRTGFNWNIPGTFATHDMSTRSQHTASTMLRGYRRVITVSVLLISVQVMLASRVSLATPETMRQGLFESIRSTQLSNKKYKSPTKRSLQSSCLHRREKTAPKPLDNSA